jgi:hypothetical protein
VAQGEGPEFKPQYQKNPKKQKPKKLTRCLDRRNREYIIFKG